MATRRKATTKPDENWWFKFDVSAWLNDPGVRLCSLAARGAWIQMLAAMYMQPVRGVLPGDVDSVGLLLGVPKGWVAPALEELEEAGVFSRGAAVHEDLPEDAIVCRRMWREHWSRARMAAGGRASGRVRRSSHGEGCPEGTPPETPEGHPEGCPEGHPKVALKVEARSAQGETKVADTVSASGTSTCAPESGRYDEASRARKAITRVRARERGNNSTTHYPGGSGVSAAGSGSADFHPPGAEEPRGPQRVGDILRRMGYGRAAPPGADDQEALEARVRARIAAALGEEAERRWGWWWDRVVPVVVAEPGGQHAVEDLLHELRRAGSPRTAHEHGIRDGGAWLAKGVRDWAVARGLALPVPGKPRNGVAR